MLNYWKKRVMKMTNEQELFVLIIIFAVTFRYLYKNRIIYQKNLLNKKNERENRENEDIKNIKEKWQKPKKKNKKR